MNIEVITCTGFRPEAFALCEKWVLSQTRQPDTWSVYDDKYRVNDSEQPTFTRNMELALQKATGDILVFMEDDDFYIPEYLQAIEGIFESYDTVAVVGAAEVIYYNVQFAKWRSLGNHTYCPMAFTAIKKDLAPVLATCLDTPNHTADVAFWHLCRQREIPTYKIPEFDFGVGVKGMPGRPGIGIGHRDLDMRWKADDAELSKAKELFGVAFEDYQPYILRT